MPISRTLLIAALLAATTVAGCSSSDAGDDSGISVVTSTSVYADIARAVGGSETDVTAFIDSPNADPHSYEANSRDILTITRADIVIENGGGYDDFMDTLLDSAKNDPIVINAVETSREADPSSGETNEHVWYDLAAMQRVADELAEALSDVDPDQADMYARNATQFNAQVQTLIDEVAAIQPQLSGTPVAITEPVPGYLIEDLGLDDLTPTQFSEAIEEGEDVSVSVLDEMLRLFSQADVEALIYNEQTSGPITERVKQAAEDAGIPIVAVTETMPEGQDYISWMSDTVDAIATALGPS